jgi:peptidoglycan/xylan/chitin deacetylase (PgdA/CDA1 family)
MSRRLALKIDVDTFRGTREGVPQLVDTLRARQAGATFLFSLGPDHTGRALKRAFRPGFMQKVGRTSVVEHYGIKTLLYGVLLPGPDIGRGAADILRATRDAGFEVGIHCWDHVKWQDGVADADEAWTDAEFDKALARFREIFGEAARVHGAAGWQMNRRALERLNAAGIAWSSDCRGRFPFLPLWEGQALACAQLPTTLPTLDELIGLDGITPANVAARLLEITATADAESQVFTLHAELEGMKLRPVFEQLLQGWQAQGYALCSLAELATGIDRAALPRCAIEWGSVPGRSGRLLVQGEAVQVA